LSFDSLHVPDTLPTSRLVGSVWRRCAAYLVDSFILGAVGGGLGRVIFDKLSHLGLWGPLAGFCVALAYFAAFDSEMGNGQTLGKRWWKLRVIDVEGNAISFAKSLLRSGVFLVPAFLFGLNLPEPRTPWIIQALVFGIVLWVGGSTLYLITFSSETRQGLHDFVAGSYVANANDYGPVEAKATSHVHWLIVVVLLVLASASVVGVREEVEKMPPMPQMRRDASLIEQMNGIERATVSERLAHTSNGGGPTKDMVVSIHQAVPAQDTFADEVVRTVLQNDPSAQNYDQLNIRFFYGYDIGIAASWNRQEFARTPAEWHQRVFDSSPTIQSSPTAHP
jgi:uncharacterized RDD family membrane protein YckC